MPVSPLIPSSPLRSVAPSDYQKRRIREITTQPASIGFSSTGCTLEVFESTPRVCNIAIVTREN